MFEEISIYYVDIHKKLLSIKFSLGKKDCYYFIDFWDGKKVRTLCVMVSKMSTYRRNFDKLYMYFLIKKGWIDRKIEWNLG